MNSEKYNRAEGPSSYDFGHGFDATGKLVMESILQTQAATILQFFAGLRGRLLVTFEESTCAVWLYDLLKPYVADPIICIHASTSQLFLRPQWQ